MPEFKIAIATLGCKVNQFESAALSDRITSMGHRVVPFSGPADVYIVNTCTVTGKTDFQSRQLVRRAARANPDAAIIVTGCYSQSSPEHFSGLDGVRLVTGNAEKDRIPDLIAGIAVEAPSLKGATLMVGDIRGQSKISALAPGSFRDRTRAFFRVQDGCDSECSYCIVPRVRGRSRSLPLELVKSRLGELAAAGHREAVFTGIHLGMYGRDLDPAISLLDMLRKIEKGPSLERVRLSSIEPLEVEKGLIEFIRDSDFVCPHLHIPLQSGDDDILAAMNRHYDSSLYAGLAKAVLEAVPSLALGTDVMTGFPGESEKNFENTLGLVSSIPFAYIHVFPYSDRPGTAASAMRAKVPAEVKNRRAATLREIGKQKRESFARRFVGSSLPVLIEGRKDRETGFLKGFSGNYIPVLAVNADSADINTIVQVRGETAENGKIIGRIERNGR